MSYLVLYLFCGVVLLLLRQTVIKKTLVQLDSSDSYNLEMAFALTVNNIPYFDLRFINISVCPTDNPINGV